MKKILSFVLSILFITTPCFAATFQGGVSEQGSGSSSRIVDRNTGLGISGAQVSIPKQNYSTHTDSHGYFELNTQINGPTIMSVQKKDYKPFSVTINSQTVTAPLVIGIEKTNADGMVLDSNMYHLGDNNFSELSANAGQFRMESIGPFYTKRFLLKNVKFNKPVFLVIG